MSCTHRVQLVCRSINYFLLYSSPTSSFSPFRIPDSSFSFSPLHLKIRFTHIWTRYILVSLVYPTSICLSVVIFIITDQKGSMKTEKEKERKSSFEDCRRKVMFFEKNTFFFFKEKRAWVICIEIKHLFQLFALHFQNGKTISKLWNWEEEVIISIMYCVQSLSINNP